MAYHRSCVLALIVGIVTALGVLRLLAPFSGINALKRVSFGERGVESAPWTGRIR